MLAIAAAPFASVAPPAQAATKPKAVIIVGPTGEMTANYLAKGKEIADQAEAAGMDVRRIFHPKATPERVLANIQGAKFVLYLGHGNGWPSPYAPFQERTKNGFGLNPIEGGSASKHVYKGANWIRSNIKLGQNAVVLIVGACYASGNGEPGMPIPGESVALERVDNYAAGFLYAGAGVVYGHGWQPKANFPQQLMTSNKTFDEIFMIPSNGSPSGFVGWKDKYFNSKRTPGARIHLDPHSSHGYFRGASGSLNVTANQWRGADGSDAIVAPSKDTSPPAVPGDFTARAGSGLEVNLSWSASTDNSSGKISYRVFRNGTKIANTDQTKFTHRPNKAGTFKYKVRAVDAAGNKSAFTPELSVSVSTSSSSTSTSSTGGPTVPTGLAAEALGYRYVKLTWKASSSSVTGTIKYIIKRNGTRIARVSKLEFTDRPASAGTYQYKIRALDAAGNRSDWTPLVSGQAIKGAL